MIIARSGLSVLALALAPLSSLASLDVDAAQHAGHAAASPSAFVETVRQATEPFRNVRDVPPEYGPALGCVSGPEQGAMGVHFVNPTLLVDDVLDATKPEALIYEFKDGAARLVGVEFIVFASVGTPPTPRTIRRFSKASCCISSTAPIASDCRRTTSCTCGRGGTTRRRVRRLESPGLLRGAVTGHVTTR